MKKTHGYFRASGAFYPTSAWNVHRQTPRTGKLHPRYQEYTPLIEAFLVHSQFETIHPFRDGNGRVGRILLAIMITERCRLTNSWLYMSAYFNRHKDEYVDRLFNVSADGQWEEWLAFCLEGVIVQAAETRQQIVELLELSRVYREKVAEVGGSHRLHSIIDGLFSIPVVRIADLHKKHGVSYATSRADVGRLEEIGILILLPNESPITYYNPDIVKIIFGAQTPAEFTKNE